MRSFLSVSLLTLVLLASCSPSLTRGYRKERVGEVAREEIAPVVSRSGRLQKYNMSLTFMKKHFSGLLLMKQRGADTCRMVLTTHFGLSVFDFEFTPDSFRVYHCIEPLRKEKILSVFRRDFTYLLRFNLQERNRAVVYRPRGGDLSKEVYKLLSRKPYCWYSQDVERGQLERMKVGSGWGSAVFDFSGFSGGLPSKIRISHSGLPLLIELEKL